MAVSVLPSWAPSSACHSPVRPLPPLRLCFHLHHQLVVPSSLRFSTPAVSARTIHAPFVVQPLASRVCDVTGKRANNGYKVSFSHHRTKKLQNVNLQRKRLWWEEGKRFVKLRLSTKAMRTIERKGLDAVAKKAGIDLNKH